MVDFFWFEAYDFFSLTPEKLDRKYIEELFEVISKNALYVNPINAFWLRTFGDYYYGMRSFFEKITLPTCSLHKNTHIQKFVSDSTQGSGWGSNLRYPFGPTLLNLPDRTRCRF